MFDQLFIVNAPLYQLLVIHRFDSKVYLENKTHKGAK